MAVKIKKCQSLKHKSIGGCGNPRCPEGLSIKNAMNDAVRDLDVKKYLETRGLLESKPEFVSKQNGWAQMLIRTPSGESKRVKYPLNRPELHEQIKNVDKTIIPSFDKLEDLNQYVKTLYGGTVAYVATISSDYRLPQWNKAHVQLIEVDADIRGLGVAKHIRQMLFKYADEHDVILSGVPTNSGDGRYDGAPGDEELYKENALQHREKLKNFYLKTGYVYNYGYRPSDKVDYWTKEPYPQDQEWVNQFNEKAQKFLAGAGFYVRFPNNKIPKNMLARKPKTASVK